MIRRFGTVPFTALPPTTLAPVLLLSLLAIMLTRVTAAFALPDNRAYELVTPLDTNGVSPGFAVPATSGNAVDFSAEPFGDAATGSQTLYQAQRMAGDWQTRALTPKNVVLSKLFGQTAPLFLTPELTQTIFTTEQPLTPGDQDKGALDLYEEDSRGELTWISQGTQGGAGSDSASYAGATPSGDQVVFDTSESLVPAATGLEESGSQPSEFLYVRNVSTGQTSLVDLNNAGALLNPEGAILGNGNYLTTGEPPVYLFLPADYYGTTTHAISDDGSKIFFESPPPRLSETGLRSSAGYHAVHLYMRRNNNVTVPLDDPTATEGAGARYLGASEDGTFVFFTSDEGLAGDPFKDAELYVYDSEVEKLTPISVASAGGSPPEAGSVEGVTAISNDGSHVYYVAQGKLAENANQRGQVAVAGRSNLYVYDTGTHTNTFVTQLSNAEAEAAPPAGRLVSYLDVERPAVPTPDGNVLVFMSSSDLTGQNPNGTAQIYRYDARTQDLTCISCATNPTGRSSLGIDEGPGGSIGGGSYDPPGKSAPMSVTGEQIFFTTETALVPEDQNSGSPPVIVAIGEFREAIPTDIDVYEWENGQTYLISAGRPGFTGLDGVTPSGSDVLLATTVDLTAQGTHGYMSLYDVRVGGGFPDQPGGVTAVCESGESCRGGAASTPVPVTPASAVPQGLVTPIPSTAPRSTPMPRKKLSTRKRAKKKRKARTRTNRERDVARARR